MRLLRVEGPPTPDESGLPAGAFSDWVSAFRAALCESKDSSVPCGECTACCTSSQFVHIGPDELDTLAHVPSQLLFPAPLRPRGHVVMGYDERGHCPMLVDNACSIYQHRPRTCRVYDCRVFPATGISLDEDSKSAIESQARRWRFDFPTEKDHVQRKAVRAATQYLASEPNLLREVGVPANPTQLAALAVEIADTFLPGAGTDDDAAAQAVRRAVGRAPADSSARRRP